VHREQGVERLGRDEVGVRHRQLQPHQGGLDPADHKETEGHDDVHDAQSLVVHRDDPLMEPVESGWRVLAGIGNQRKLGGRH
jgi:hypothetical protein